MNKAKTNNTPDDLLFGIFCCVAPGAYYRAYILIKHINGIICQAIKTVPFMFSKEISTL